MTFCLGKRSDLEILGERDEMICIKYYDLIEHFPDKIDQLPDTLDRVCL